jgi:hypothetical protein
MQVDSQKRGVERDVGKRGGEEKRDGEC